MSLKSIFVKNFFRVMAVLKGGQGTRPLWKICTPVAHWPPMKLDAR